MAFGYAKSYSQQPTIVDSLKVDATTQTVNFDEILSSNKQIVYVIVLFALVFLILRYHRSMFSW